MSDEQYFLRRHLRGDLGKNGVEVVIADGRSECLADGFQFIAETI